MRQKHIVILVELCALMLLANAPISNSGNQARFHVVGDPVSISSVNWSNNFTWPGNGQESAIEINGANYFASQAQFEMPIASITKLVVALVILNDHPIELGSEGPQLTISSYQASFFDYYLAQDGSVAKLEIGEKISLYELLCALLMSSADNVASVLAVWDANSVNAFVVKMNDYATYIGMGHTHFVEPSGIDAGNISTPSDLIKLGQVALENPVISSIVKLDHIIWPVFNLWLLNYNPILHYPGVTGLKSGYSSQSGATLLFSMTYTINGVQISIIGAILGYKGPEALENVGNEAIFLANEVISQIKSSIGQIGNHRVYLNSSHGSGFGCEFNPLEILDSNGNEVGLIEPDPANTSFEMTDFPGEILSCRVMFSSTELVFHSLARLKEYLLSNLYLCVSNGYQNLHFKTGLRFKYY